MATSLPQLTIYAVNRADVTIGDLTISFSYRTPIAFDHPGLGLVVSENCWSTTTGKHLNQIDEGDKKGRLPRDRFEAALEYAVAGDLARARSEIAKADPQPA